MGGRFLRSFKWYHYNSDQIYILTRPKKYDLEHVVVRVKGVTMGNLSALYSYRKQAFWVVVYPGPSYSVHQGGEVEVSRSCLEDKASRDVLTYLREVAASNPMGQSFMGYEGEEPQSTTPQNILLNSYSEIQFLDDALAVAPYLNPAKRECSSYSSPSVLIFPFGCNASQYQAVTNAFTHQLSVIQGPPVTGKTQTILNIVANILLRGSGCWWFRIVTPRWRMCIESSRATAWVFWSRRWAIRKK